MRVYDLYYWINQNLFLLYLLYYHCLGLFLPSLFINFEYGFFI
jgi:hypothetical protein